MVTKNSMTTGSASLIFKINELPKGGLCYVDKYNGLSLQTDFNILCVDWLDSDGTIERYEYFGKV